MGKTVVVAAALLLLGSGLQAAALSYSGDDISSGNGTLTITCSDQVSGDLWELDIKRLSSNRLVQMVKFDDLTDGGTYNYADSWDWGYGLLMAHKKPATGLEGTFAELHKGSDYYSYKMTLTKSVEEEDQWRQETTYRINPSTESGTQFTVVCTVTNISGEDQADGQWKCYMFFVTMALNADPYDYNDGGCLSDYDQSGFCTHLQYDEGPDAIWEVTDNLNADNPQREAGEPAWGQGKVMDNAATEALDLAPGRTFKLSTDIDNNSTAASQFSALLRIYPQYPLFYTVSPYDWGYPATWYDNTSYTRNYTLDINIASISNAPPVADAGDDQTAHDEDDDGEETVTLDGSGSSDSDGSITSWVWTEGTSQIATGETAQVDLDVGVHTITLTVTDDGAATDADTVVVTVNGMPVADAGDDEAVIDSDDNGSETVTLDGSGSSDDATLASWVWKEDGSQIATGETAQVALAVGLHDVQLTVTDSYGYTDSDVVRIWVIPDVDYYVDQDDPNASDSNDGSEGAPWLTIGHAVDNVAAGDVILVREGIYRESASLGASGSSGNPITLMGCPGERVVVSGADEVTGWTQCTSQTAKGNPNYANIYYADVAWQPTRLTQDDVDLAQPREPANGKWVVTGGTTSTLVDTVNLTQADDYWNGSTVSLYDASAGVTYNRLVTDFVSATSTLTVNAVWYGDRTPESGTDRYYLTNSVKLIDDEGQWAVEDLGGGSYRLYAWAYDDGDPDSYMMEASRRSSGIYLGTRSYWTLDNLEVRQTTLGWGYGIGTTNSGGAGNITIQNCLIHHNDGYGIQGAYDHGGLIRRNCLVLNRYGVSTIGANGVVVEENEVGWNTEDGVRPTGLTGENWAEDMTVRHNYIHDHIGQNHPDGAQSFNNVRDVVFEDNFIICSGQNYMGQGVDGITFTGNVIIGSMACSVIYGGGCQDATTENNTILCAGYGLFSAPTDGGHYKNNILVQGHGSSRVWVVGDVVGYASDYNCFWQMDGYTKSPVVWDSNWNWTFAQYQSGSGEDAHSVHADPLLANVPTYFVKTNETRQNEFTATRVYMTSAHADLFEVGDYIEIDWDSTVRTVTAVGDDYVDFTPGDSRFMDKAWMVGNWLETTDYHLDVTLEQGSPAIGTADDEGDMGASIDIDNLMAGDFNGDGRRDIPVWPPQQ